MCVLKLIIKENIVHSLGKLQSIICIIRNEEYSIQNKIKCYLFIEERNRKKYIYKIDQERNAKCKLQNKIMNVVLRDKNLMNTLC